VLSEDLSPEAETDSAGARWTTHVRDLCAWRHSGFVDCIKHFFWGENPFLRFSGFSNSVVAVFPAREFLSFQTYSQVFLLVG